MVLYNYQCQKCKNIIDIYQSIKDEELFEYYCDKCKSIQNIKKVILKSNFILKGDGWAKSGYQKNSEKVENLI